jgi:hypothetical protein
MKTVRLRLLVFALGFTALFTGTCYPQGAEPIAYSIDQPIHIGETNIAVRSVRIYGSQDAIED